MALGTLDSVSKVHQGVLGEILSRLFKGENVISNSRKESTIKGPFSSYFLELDIWIAELYLCFEFQDDYHYTPTWYSQKSLDLITQRDNAKRESVIRKEITLIVIPCWWDGHEKSLVATIQFYRPDLLVAYDAGNTQPIPLTPPYKFFSHKYIPDVGRLMLSSFASSMDFINSISTKKFWWIGEKYDGIRVCWHPRRKLLYNRTGNRIEVPLTLRLLCPSMFLDGELWFGRGSYAEAQELLFPLETTPDWSSLRLIGFDNCLAESESIAFERRYQTVIRKIPTKHPFAIPVFRVKCYTKQQLLHFMKSIMKDGGEGVILREPRSLYYRGRSSSLVKLKAASGDKEGLVLRTKPDGSITLLLPDGVTVSVPHENIATKIRPIKGDIVSFSYESHSRVVLPINPRVYRIRKDVSWEDLVLNYETEVSLNDISLKAVGNSDGEVAAQQRTTEKETNLRLVLEKFAQSHALDPLKPDTWYNLSSKFTKLEESRALLAPHRGSILMALPKIFPELKFDATKFPFVPRNYWKNIDNKRKFFFQFAKFKEFDPLVPENWYKTSVNEFTQFKGSRAIIEYQSYPAAVAQAFPEIGIIPSRFADYTYRHFLVARNRKKFFVEFAKTNAFDPLVPDNWYTVNAADLSYSREGELALQHYGGNYVKALTTLFPDIGLVDRKFVTAPKKYMSVVDATKRFFDGFAKIKHFDPLVPVNWYSVSNNSIASHEGANEILHHYRKSVVKALLVAYPQIGLEEELFSSVPRKYWENETNRRQFFEQFAEANGFDPLSPENWYTVATTTLAITKAVSIVKNYNNSYKTTLQKLFPELKFDTSKFVNLV